jgi:3,4-dihydroxy-2-butanone 4-phosphate synthase
MQSFPSSSTKQSVAVVVGHIDGGFCTSLDKAANEKRSLECAEDSSELRAAAEDMGLNEGSDVETGLSSRSEGLAVQSDADVRKALSSRPIGVKSRSNGLVEESIASAGEPTDEVLARGGLRSGYTHCSVRLLRLRRTYEF